ncbi:hypothetical protein B9Z55_027885 [Caenorhabditis nigoni]|uniref:Golgin subfamily A conserved domain-containing protein n=1 Tax=Caenorhabditis nigoni TaxID=1611254 RepID=A0A2G5SEE4_9PELO|nr:hypothetical protein B9Z55_027885 [Caenorhabditis nigoni]
MDSSRPSTSSSFASETVPERQNAQEPVFPSPNTSSNRVAAMSADRARIDESNPPLSELMKSYSEHITVMNYVFSTIIKKYEELEREIECLQREAESTKAKFNDQESQLHIIQTEMNTQKNELENLSTEKNDLET